MNKLFGCPDLLMSGCATSAENPEDQSASQIDRYNVIWDSPSKDAAGSMPLGNGELGINLWVEENSDLLFYLGRNDSFSEISQLCKVGKIRVSLTPNPFKSGIPFKQELKLINGVCDISAGDVKLKVFVDSANPVVHVVGQSASPLTVTARIESWREQKQKVCKPSYWTLHDAPFEVWQEADHFPSGLPDAIAWYHRNETSTAFEATVKTQSLESIRSSLKDPLLHRTFGGWVTGAGFKPVDNRTVATVPTQSFDLCVSSPSAQTATAQEWLNMARSAAARSLDKNSALSRTARSWHDFWQRSWVVCDGGSGKGVPLDALPLRVGLDADGGGKFPGTIGVVTVLGKSLDESKIAEHASVATGTKSLTQPMSVGKAHTLQRYMHACAGRGIYPIKFNGSIFTVEPTHMGEGDNPDWRKWGDCHWWQNVRMPYHAMQACGDYDLMMPLFNMFENIRPFAEARAKLYHNVEGCYFAETMTVWGTYSNGDYGWDRAGHQPKDILCPWWQYAWNQGLEIVALQLDYYEYTQDREFLETYLMPMATSVLKYFDTRFKKDADGRILIDPTQAVETYWHNVVNDTPCVAGLNDVTARLCNLPESVTAAGQRAFFAKMKAAAPILPVEEAKLNGKPVRRIAVAQEYNPKRSNCENPELFPIWPFRLAGLGKPLLEEARNGYALRGGHNDNGWGYDSNAAALLGLTDEAARILQVKICNTHGAYRWPATWGPNFDWLPDHCHGGNLMETTNLMLLQADGGGPIRILPAWPQKWDVNFKLHAPGNTVVACELRDGKILKLEVHPKSRAKDIILPDWAKLHPETLGDEANNKIEPRNVEVKSEQIGAKREDWDKPAWEFRNIHRPSKAAASANAKTTIIGQAEMACLSPSALTNGVMPQQTRLRRDFFAFANGSDGGFIVMDLGKTIPVAEINSYSAHGPVGGTTWGVEFDGTRGPQVFTLYGSSSDKPDTSKLSAPSQWTKIADVDTRPESGPWGGRWGVNIRDSKGALLGNFRWLVWKVRRTVEADNPNVPKTGFTRPEFSNTWFTELDVHTPHTLAQAGDFVPAGTQLKEIIVAYKTHFDIGFTHPAPEIVNIYRTTMIDHALQLVDNSIKLPPEERFAWTIPSWVAYQVLWDGQDPVRRERVLSAIKDGSLVVHAIPVTMHIESLDLETLASSLGMNASVAKQAGIPPSRAGKMTDPPCHSWFLPTLLTNAGIKFLHIGCNPCNQKPDVPQLFDWEGPDGSRLLTMLNQGYGSDCEFGHGLYPPKDWPYKHWLSMMTSCDNAGPPSENEVKQMFEEVKRNLPGVKVRLGKMEDFSEGIRSEEEAGAKIPVVRADMPDPWIHGTATMPREEALARKTRMEISAVESLDSHLRIWGLPRPDIKEKLSTAYERSAMFSEHTWGTCKNLEGCNAYGIKDFEQYVKTDGTCQFLQKTWDDHADYIRKTAQITEKLAKTEIEQLAASTDLEGKRIVVFNPLLWKRDAWIELPDGGNILVKDLPPSGYKTISLPSLPSVPSEVSETAILENKFLKVILDRARGGIVSIIDKKSGRELVDKKAKYAFGQYVLERFGRKQCDDYQIACNHLDSIYDSNGRACLGWNIRNDLPKDTQHAESAAAFSTMTVSRGANSQTARLSAQPAGIIESQVVTTITLPNDVPWLEISVQLKDKKPNYAPEAGQLCFPVNADTPQFRIGRLGGVVNPATNFVRGSNRTYGQVDTGAMIAGQDGNGVAICPIDQGIMSFGEKRLPDIDPDYVPATPMARLSIFNNFWTTNFPYWIQGDVSTRVRIWPTTGLETASLVIPALEARNPAMVGFSDGPAGKLPAEQAGLSVSRPCIRLTAFRQTDDGTLLRLWEQTGVSGEVCVTLGAPNSNTASPLTFTSALPVNLRGEKIGDPIPIKNSNFSFNLGAYAPASFILTPKLPVSAKETIPKRIITG